jgi:hypothetical protein
MLAGLFGLDGSMKLEFSHVIFGDLHMNVGSFSEPLSVEATSKCRGGTI